MADEKTKPDPAFAASFEGPAPAANRFFLTIAPQTARLAFIEMAPDDAGIPPRFRSAVSLSHQDLAQLRDLLNTMIPQAPTKH